MKKPNKQFQITYCCDDLKNELHAETFFFYSQKDDLIFHFAETDAEFYFCPFCGKPLSQVEE